MASQRGNIVISALFTVFGGPGIILVFLPYWITGFRFPAGESFGQMLVTGALIVVGLTPLLESVFRFIFVGEGTVVPTAATKHLVVSGLYRYVRNPMYAGVTTVLAGEALLFWSRGIVIEAIVVCLCFILFVHFYEEPTLTRRYPSDYPRYKENVPRWVPRLTPWEGLQS